MKESIPFNFGGLSEQFSNYNNAKIAVLPVPFDKTSTWMKGADKGPSAILEASMNMELYDIETDTEVYTKGSFTEKEINAHDSLPMISEVYKKVRKLISDNKFVVTLGGEHTVSIGSIRAYSEAFGSIDILQLDAHADMRNSYNGNEYSHACFASRAKDLADNVVSVGIRSMDSTELENIDKNKIIYAAEIHTSDNWIQKVVNQLSAKVYISIDLDVFDPGVMPSTGTPEPGGLNWYQVVRLLKEVSNHKDIIGFDVVELCPSQNKAPDFLAAKLIYKLLGYNFYPDKA
jgi:agmatinase